MLFTFLHKRGKSPLFNARFENCHSKDMTDKRELLLSIRNQILQQPIGGVLLSYLQDYITAEACKNRNADEIKGMCELVQQIKEIPENV